MKLLVITVNYTSAEHVLRCLDKLIPQLEAIGDAIMWIVDNNSPDNSIHVLREGIAAREMGHIVRLIESPVNGGFGAGNNIAFREALELPSPPLYFYLLNPDSIPDPGTVAALLNFMVAYPHVGVIGGALRDQQNCLQCSTFRFPSLLSEIEYHLKLGIMTKLLRNHQVSMETPKQAMPVDWVTGANMMIRREVIEQVGLFDENFFLYWEEVDLCRRVRDAGYEIYFVPHAIVLHISGVTTGMTSPNRRIPKYWFDSRAYYLKKTFGPGSLIVFNLIVAGCISLHRMRQYLLGREMESPHFMRDFVRYNFLPRRQERS
ncbi:glycosyl transferase, group 2 family protein [Thioploca ingrica]|uniref:Glycosyl transferase, group 2 family protein n=1 Tax=Thioploca ingrica TaxID=40754 RepID=A0A090BVZ0_9GAMM|nr:glycosyl transferase, group 2 family protein [Thioploca ingrica]